MSEAQIIALSVIAFLGLIFAILGLRLKSQRQKSVWRRLFKF